MAGSSLASAVPSAGLISRSRFRGCLLGALLGDCLGGGFESLESVNPAELLRFVRSLQPQDKDEEEEGVAGDKSRVQCFPGRGEKDSDIFLSVEEQTSLTINFGRVVKKVDRNTYLF
ncbi:UNVERIFIED_CONTAM: hypothetical protein K2H54_056086 [Gekko kuhli]